MDINAFWTARPDTEALTLVVIALVIGVLLSVFFMHRRGQRESRRRYQGIFTHNNVPMLVIEPENFKLLDANAAACAFYGYARRSLTNKTIFDISVQPRERVVEIRDQLRLKRQHTFSSRHRLASGETSEVECYATFFPVRGREKILLIVHDVTGRKKIEHALEESERRYHLVADYANDLIFIVDLAMRPTYISPSVQRMLGYTVEEAMGLKMEEIFTPASYAETMRILETEMEKERQGARPRDARHMLVIEMIHKNRSTVIVESNYSAIHGPDGKPAAIMAVARDVTGRIQMEQELARGHSLLRTIVDNLPIRLYAKDLQHRFIMANQETANKMRAPSPEALLGKTDADFYARRLAEAFQTEEETIFRTGQPLLNKEDTWPLRSGREEISLTTKVPLRDARTGALTGLVGIAQDLTQRKQIERSLQESEERFKLFINFCPAAVYIKDQAGRLLVASRRLEQIFERPLQDLIGKTNDALAPPEIAKRWNREEAEVIETGQPREIDEELNGRHYSSWKFPIPRQGKPTLLGVFSLDITEQTETQQQLIQSQKIESVGRLAGGIAHDFNNLLQTILGFSELLLEGMSERDERRDDLIEIQRAAKRAAMLTSQLLAFSRKQMIHTELMDLNKFVEETSRMLRRLIGEDIQLRLVTDSALWQVKADAGQIGQIIMNLVVNARDAISKGGQITITTSNVTLQEQDLRMFPESQQGRYVCLTVSDTGAGMSKEIMGHLFEPFFTTKGVGKGSGMGLAMIYGLVKQHGGWINVYSEVGHGSTFKMYLPAAEMDATNAKAAAGTDNAKAKHLGRGERILLVEDDAGVRALSLLILQSHGYKVFSTVDAQSALALFEREKGRFDLLFSDVVLNDFNGIELAEKLKARSRGLRVLMTSGYTDDQSHWPVIGKRGWDFIQKPFSTTELLTAVRAVIDRTTPA